MSAITDRRALLSLEEARTLMLDGLEPLPAEDAALQDAVGRVVSRDHLSRLTLPPWDNSAMDGFALRAQDVADVTSNIPVTLRVIGEAAAGRLTAITVEPGTALRILTGAPLPPGADAVVAVEQTDAAMGVAALPATVAIGAPVSVGAHVRRAGSDLTEGRLLLGRGTQASAASLAVAAAGGYSTISVHRRPRLALLATGDELVPAGSRLGPAQIPDSNSVGLAVAAREAGAESRSLGIARDSADDVVARLQAALDWADVIVVSGGVSVGAHDVVKDAFARIGQVDLWRVAVQPGKPLAFGRAGHVLLFGLPGNPVSSLVTFELFVRPVVRRLSGQQDLSGRQIVLATLEQNVSKSAGRRAFLRVNLSGDGNEWRASLAGGQESHMLSALAAADGLAVVPEEVDSLPAGAQVEVIRIR